MQSMSENDFECLASTGVNTPATMFSDSGSRETKLVRGFVGAGLGGPRNFTIEVGVADLGIAVKGR